VQELPSTTERLGHASGARFDNSRLIPRELVNDDLRQYQLDFMPLDELLKRSQDRLLLVILSNV
jgi:hypothetical protein